MCEIIVQRQDMDVCKCTMHHSSPFLFSQMAQDVDFVSQHVIVFNVDDDD
jgi:hypothetical protein